MASAAAIWRPEPIPPAASTGRGATASMTSGHRTRLPIVAGVAATLGALAHDEVEPGLLVVQRVLDRPGQCPDHATRLLDQRR